MKNGYFLLNLTSDESIKPPNLTLDVIAVSFFYLKRFEFRQHQISMNDKKEIFRSSKRQLSFHRLIPHRPILI